MLMFDKPFIELCLAGRAAPADIDDYIDAWHESDSELPLHEFLGMSGDEYGRWVEDSDALDAILASRKRASVAKSPFRRSG